MRSPAVTFFLLRKEKTSTKKGSVSDIGEFDSRTLLYE